MRRRRFAEGGYTDQEASDLMLNDVAPKRESIRLTSDEPATPQSAADQRAEDAAILAATLDIPLPKIHQSRRLVKPRKTVRKRSTKESVRSGKTGNRTRRRR